MKALRDSSEICALEKTAISFLFCSSTKHFISPRSKIGFELQNFLSNRSLAFVFAEQQASLASLAFRRRQVFIQSGTIKNENKTRKLNPQRCRNICT